MSLNKGHKMINLTWHTDAGHGWLATPVSLIESLKLEHKISRHSYFDRRAAIVYLEEDCDAPLFITEALKAGMKLNYKEHVYTDDAPIRALPRY
jgi:hypothetical protein